MTMIMMTTAALLLLVLFDMMIQTNFLNFPSASCDFVCVLFACPMMFTLG
jgi:hypothetical protein